MNNDELRLMTDEDVFISKKEYDNYGIKMPSFALFEIVVIPKKRKQNRKHKKKRINKKWAKRYGFKEDKYPYVKDGEIIMFANKVYMNEDTFIKMKQS